MQVKPPLTDKEMVQTFLTTLKKPCYDYILGYVTASFFDLVLRGENIGYEINSGRLTTVETLHLLVDLQNRENGSNKTGSPNKMNESKKENGMHTVHAQPKRNVH